MSKYLRYEIKNMEPIRIADNSSSQLGQTMTLRYIPGSAIRGLIVNSFLEDDDFHQIKKLLFSNQIRYLNAYPAMNGKELMPSPKGFYEDKTQGKKKEIQNVVTDGNFKEGFKRASLGNYCYMKDGCIRYYHIKTGSDMKIKMNIENAEKKNVFRNEYIMPGYHFVGYIVADEDTELILERMKNILQGQVILGNGRSAGMGKCMVKSCEYADDIPYQEYQADQDLSGECYMMLLSNTVMRDAGGSYCGLDLESIEFQMGVSDLEIKFCSTSTVESKGFNRTWMGPTPSLVMYEQGSVFHFSYRGKFTAERAHAMMDRGIGVRRNEGFGRVLFLKDYGQVHFKQEGEQDCENRKIENHANLSSEDMEVLKIAAHRYYKRKIEQAVNRYVVDEKFKIGNITSSRLGQIASIAETYQYHPIQGISYIKKYLAHISEKEGKQNIQKSKNKIDGIAKIVSEILDHSLEETLQIKTKHKDMVMGIKKEDILSAEETGTIKLQLLISLARYENKLEKEM
ncbi:MAG: hypothetical protein K2L07_13625 [Lachnospiraceae bacterium]|nr:hypothetical protein [Lachnospiraceae bacterium]